MILCLLWLQTLDIVGFSMSCIHFWALSVDKNILNVRVFSIQPNTVLVSFGHSSTLYFVCCTALFCLTLSLSATGLNIACAIKGPRIKSRLSLVSMPHVILLSM